MIKFSEYYNNGDKMTNNDMGNIAESNFILKATKKNLNVSTPVVGEHRYDFIIDNGNELFKVQVKSTFSYDQIQDRYSVNISYGNNPKKAYTKTDIDYFAIYINNQNSWYIIPIEDIDSKKVNLYPHRKNNGIYERYKDNWKVLR